MNPAELSTAECADCAVCASLLDTGRLWSGLAAVSALAVLLSLAAPGCRPLATHAPALLSALLATGVAERVLASRVHLDARLFAQLARADLPGLPALDAALRQVLNVPADKAGRSLAPRIAGAKRLYRWHLTSTLVLAGLGLAAWWPC